VRIRAAVLFAALALLPAGVGAQIRPEERRSDTTALGGETRAMQADDAANPGMLAVLDGEALWQAKAGPAGRACADCHGDAATSMRGVAARYPTWSRERAAPIDLAGQIDLCRTARQDAPPLAPESPERLALTAYVAHQSRGLPISVPADPGMVAARVRGRVLFETRMGQLNLACATCHDSNWGKRLGGAPIPQAHPVGYPIYRLEWQAVGSLQRRFRNCMAGVRAEPLPFDAPDFVDLEAFLMERAAGLAIETPAVRP
jgi:sulfur-oxidizing protein SoxA